MPYFFTSESVSEGHPDKVADQISDAIVDAFLLHDPNAKVACETLVTTGKVIISGEIRCSDEAKNKVDAEKIARDVIAKIGYTKPEYLFDAKSCDVQLLLHEQSSDINQGVDRGKEEEQGAGDQGMMFGYANSETENYMPLTLELSHQLLLELAAIRKESRKMNYLRPDAKSQVTIQYSEKGKPERIDSIVISTQHDENVSQQKIKEDIQRVLFPRLVKRLRGTEKKLLKNFATDSNHKLYVNPTGNFVIGGPHGDTGLTGRKIIVDTYGGHGAHGGGAFSGKDSSKVDRSAAYATRHIAKNLVASGVCKEALVQVAYAIGMAKPVGLYVNTFNSGSGKVRNSKGKKMSDSEISDRISKLVDMRPASIVKRLGLKNPIFSETASYGHMGRIPSTKNINGHSFETFTWEKLNLVDSFKNEFHLS